MRDAPLREPRLARRSAVRHRKGYERGLEFASDADERRYAGTVGRCPNQWRSQSEPRRFGSVGRGGDGLQAVSPAPYGAKSGRFGLGSPLIRTTSNRSGVSAFVSVGCEFQSTLVTFSVSNCTSSCKARLTEWSIAHST